jgi:hypothetical protein
MTKFVVEVQLLCRFNIEAETEEQAKERLWDGPQAGLDFPGIVGSPIITAMTEAEFNLAPKLVMEHADLGLDLSGEFEIYANTKEDFDRVNPGLPYRTLSTE